MLKALCDHLLEKPNLYLDEVAIFLWNEFQVRITTCYSRALRREGWPRKAAKHKARDTNADLRDFHFISDFCSYHLMYVDESGCDKRVGFRRTSWSPLGIAPTQVAKSHHDRQYQILPAYAQDGVILPVFSKAPPTGQSPKFLLRSCFIYFIIVEDGRSQNLFLLWIMPHFITLRD